MFDITDCTDGVGTLVPTAAEVAAVVATLQQIDARVADAQVSDGERVELIGRLEQVKSAAAAAQAQVSAAFAVSQEAEQTAAGVDPDEVGKGVAAQVGLAKRESPFKARRYLGWAKILTAELPHTLAALRAGETTEWRAMLVGRETGWLSAEDRARVDAELAGRLGGLGDRAVETETKKLAYRLDPAGAAQRSARAATERRVSLRPAPETMSYLTALLPVAQGVAAYAALQGQADTLVGEGDDRSRGQIMADTLVERATGQQQAEQTPVEVQLVMTDQTLLGNAVSGPGADEPGQLHGYGPVPAPWARRLLAEADEHTAVWLRRLFARPGSGQLVAMESRRRCFPAGLRRLLITRDRYCRTPWCGAPIRHADHVHPAEGGGPTSEANGQGLCAACNHAKHAPGWASRAGPGGAGGSVVITTPTGHRYTSRPPDLPGVAAQLGESRSRVEFFWREHVLAA